MAAERDTYSLLVLANAPAEMGACDELQSLIEAQERDAQWGHRIDARGPSLNFEFDDGGSFADLVGYGASGDSAVRNVPSPKKWTNRMIVSAIRRWEKEHGTPPTYNEWRSANGRGIPPCVTVQRRFGTFNAAIAAAGFAPRGVGGERAETPQNRGRSRMRAQRPDSRLTQRQLAAAYALYDRGELSMPELAERLWDRYGFTNPAACRNALWRGFHAEGFPLRSMSEALTLARAKAKASR